MGWVRGMTSCRERRTLASKRGFVLVTRAGAGVVIEQSARLDGEPIRFTGDVAFDLPGDAEQEGNRRAVKRERRVHAVACAGTRYQSAGIETDREVAKLQFLDEGGDQRPIAIGRDGNDREVGAAVSREPVQYRQFSAAGWAPRCPEIDEHHLAAEGRRIERSCTEARDWHRRDRARAANLRELMPDGCKCRWPTGPRARRQRRHRERGARTHHARDYGAAVRPAIRRHIGCSAVQVWPIVTTGCRTSRLPAIR